MVNDPVEVAIVTRSAHPDFLDLPWHEPLARWGTARLVRMAHGVSRHVVRFVRYGQRVYALKETDTAHAEAEYRTLRALFNERLPVVEPVGYVHSRASNGGAVLITRYLDFSLPYWYVLGREAPASTQVLVDAAVVLLVRLHLAGVFWGDCSLSNVLFRRDAGALMAYLVDAETTEQRPSISDRLRSRDLDIAHENFAGGLLDLQAAGRVPGAVDPIDVADDLRSRYRELWGELTRTDRLDATERWRIDSRVRRINELGFDVEELALRTAEGGHVLDITPSLVEEGHHARELRQRTGLEVQENQARRLLADIENFRARLGEHDGRSVPAGVAAARWLAEVYEPVVDAIPPALRSRLEPAEIFHQLLEHRYLMAERTGHEISNGNALADYLATILPTWPDEQHFVE